MFGETSYTKDPAGALEERELLQQVVSLGVGYPHGRPWFSKAAISNISELRGCIPRMRSLQKCSDVGGITQEAQHHIRNGDNGYYLLDLHKGRILARGQHPIKDILIDFTLSGTDDRVLLRKRKGTCFHDTGFLIVPNAVYFLGMDRAYQLDEFHMLSFISLDGARSSGLVMDYDVIQTNRPLVLFPCEENNDIIQAQLDHDDHCLTEEYESLARNTGFNWINI